MRAEVPMVVVVEVGARSACGVEGQRKWWKRREGKVGWSKKWGAGRGIGAGGCGPREIGGWVRVRWTWKWRWWWWRR